MKASIRGRRLTLTGAVAVLVALIVPSGSAIAGHNEDVHTDNISVTGRDSFPYGTDLAFRDRVAVAGAGAWDSDYPTGVYLEDISKPEPKRLSFLNCNGWHSDVDFVGDLVVQSHDSGGDNSGCQPGEGKEGIRVIDASNPRRPESIGFAELPHGSHNLTAVGETGLVYVSAYNLTDPSDVDGLWIADVGTNPVDPPVKFLEFPDLDNRPEHEDMRNESGDLPDSMGCHDIGLDLDRDLAFCAGITETMIWDISGPRDPVIIEIIRNPGVNIHHGAAPNEDGDVLIINDEWLGAAGAGTGCALPGAPTGALWFYDISNPRNPQPRGFWSPDVPEPLDDFCTSHFYEAFEDEGGRDLVVTSWYEHGVYVIDFSDPTAPQEIAAYDPQGANFWSAYEEGGYLYANSFAPATLLGNNPAVVDKGGLWVFALDGLTPSGKGKGKGNRPEHAGKP